MVEITKNPMYNFYTRLHQIHDCKHLSKKMCYFDFANGLILYKLENNLYDGQNCGLRQHEHQLLCCKLLG